MVEILIEINCLFHQVLFQADINNNIIGVMSQNQDGNDPYTEYQRILAQSHHTQPPPTTVHRHIEGGHNKEIEVPLQMLQIVPKKVYIPAIKPPIVLDTNDSQQHQFNQTIKRTPANQYLSPQYCRNSQTKSQIRMKILLENNRLKSNVQTLKKDLDNHRINELKVAQILKQSKQKISDFKNALKEKSKRITEVTQNNIQLRGVINEMQSKINHLTSYSQWQQAQLRSLNELIEEKEAEIKELKSFQATIDKYENILKNYEMNLLKQQQNLSNQASRCSLNAEIISIHTLSERSPQKWGTINELGMQEVNNLKQKHENISNKQDYEILSDQNSTLRLKVNELQKELQAIREQIGDKQKQWQNSMMKNLSKSDRLKDEIQQAKTKSQHMQFLLKQRQEQIDRLSKQIFEMKEDLQKKKQINNHSEKNYFQQIEQLNKLIERKDELINQLKQKLIQKQDYIKKVEYEQYINSQEKQAKFDRFIKELQQTIMKCHSRNEQLQKKNELLIARVEQMESNQQQNQHHLQTYRTVLLEKERLLQAVDKLREQNEELNLKIKQQQHLYEQKLEQAHHQLAATQQYKNIENATMQKYAREISELKNKLESFSYQRLQSNKTHYQRAIEEQHQEEQSIEDSSMMRQGELQGNKQYYTTSKYDREQVREGPLEEQQLLRSSSQSSRAEIRLPRPPPSSISQNILALQQRLLQERSAHNISLVQVNYKLDQQRQKNSQLKQTINELQQKIKLISIESIEKKLALQIKQMEIQKMKRKMQQNKIEYEQTIEKLNKKILQNTEQLKKKSEVNFQLGLELNRMQSENMEMSHKVYNLENSNKKYSSQRAILQSQLSRMKNQWNNISEQNNTILQKKIEELKSSLEGQLQDKYQQENQLYFSMQMQQKESEIQATNKAKLTNLQQRINQLQHQLQKSQEKDALFNQERLAVEQKIARMQQEIEELENKCVSWDQVVKQKGKEILDYRERLRQYQNELKIKESNLEEALFKNNQHEQYIRQANIQKEVISKQIGTKNKENLQLTAQLEYLHSQNKDTVAKLQTLQEQIIIYVKNEQKSQLEKQKYQHRLQTLQNIIQQQKNNIEKSQIEKQELANSNLKISTDMSEFVTKIKQLQQAKQSITLKLNHAEEINHQITQEMNHLRQEKENIYKENLRLASQIQKIQQTIKIKDTKIEQLDNNLANLLSSLEYSRTENQEKLNALRDSLSRQNELNLSVKMEQVLNTKKQMETLRNQIGELKKQQKSTEQEYIQYKRQAQKQKEELILKNCESCAKIEELQQANFSFSKLIQSKSDQIISFTNAVSQKELILQQKTQLLDIKDLKITELEGTLDRVNKETAEYKQKTEKQIQSLQDNIEVRKKMMQQLEDDHQMKINKLQKEISNLKLMVDQTQKQASERLEKSTHTINQVQNKLKMQVELSKQKDQQIKNLRQTNSVLKEINQMLKKSEGRFEQQRQRWQQIKQQKQQEISSNKAEMVGINNQLNSQIRQNEQIQSQNLKITLELNQVKVEIEQILNQKLTLQKQLKQLKVKVSKGEHQKLFMITTNQSLQLKIKQLQEELNELRKEYQVSKSEIHKTQVYLQDEILQKSKMQQLYQSIQIQKQEIYQKVNHLSVERQQIEQRARKTQESLQQECIKMKQQTDILNAKILQLEKEITRLEKEKKQIEDSLASTQKYLQDEVLEKSRVQQLHQKMLQQKQQIEMKLSRVIIEFDEFRESSIKNSPAIDELKLQNESLKQFISKMEKQHSSRLQLMRTQTRDHGLELERKHSKQVEELCEQLSKLRSERDNSKIELDKAKKAQKQLKDQTQKLKTKISKYEKQSKQFENERGQLTDKILQLTQQNDEFNEIIQNLRHDVINKGNELFEYKEIIQKLQEENQELKSNQPLSNQSLQANKQQDNELEQEYYELKAVVLQLQAKNEILQTQINQKIKNERTLTEKLQQLKVRQTRERNSSGDSYVSRSRIFIDEKSQYMQAELQEYKCKYESAQAYIETLEQQIKKSSNSQLQLKIAQLQKELNNLKEQNQNLQAKVQYQNAYIDHLETDNIKNSVISKKSTRSKRDDKGLLKVDKDHSVVSVMENSHRTDRPAQIERLNDKIKSVNDFIQKFNREKDNGQTLKQFRKKLSNATLDQLLSTILYRLDKEANHYRQKQHQNEQISMDNQHLQEEIKELHQTLYLLQKKLQLNNNVQTKYEQAKNMLQQTLIVKVKQEMEIAQFKRRIQQLENIFPQNGHDSLRAKEQKLLSASMRRQKQKQRLSILHQENEDGSSDSMMSENAESQIPSSVHQSKDLKCSLDIKLKTSENFQLRKNKLSRTNSLSDNDKTFTIEFLYRLLDKIDEIDSQVAYIQIELEEKAEKLTEVLGNSTIQESLVGKLQQIQTKLYENQKDLRRHKESSQNQIASIFRQFIKSIEIQEDSGFPVESKKRIEEYLKLLQLQLTKTKQLQQEKSQLSRTETSPQKLKLNMQQIKQDIINEDKSSSIVNPNNSRVSHSYSNSEGGLESFKNNETKASYSEVVRQLKQVNDELTNKEQKIRILSKKGNLINRQVSSILDQLLLNFDQNQYLFQQTDRIKQILNQFSVDDISWTPVKDSFEKRQEYQKMMMQIESNTKKQVKQQDSKTNPVLQLTKLNTTQFLQMIEEIANQELKNIKKTIEQAIQFRYEDCLQFLNNQQSLILDILKVNQETSAEEQMMQKLAAKLTKEQITDIITNSQNKKEARMTLFKIIAQDSKSQLLSNQNDFSPDIEKMHHIRNKVFRHPTQLSLLLHNQLIKILGAPTRQIFYDLIEQFYQIIRRQEQKINEQASERQSLSQNHSMRLKKLLQQPLQNMQIDDTQRLDHIQIRVSKLRSSSCVVNGSETNIAK